PQEGRLGYQSNDCMGVAGGVSQLSPGWVYMACNQRILGGRFGNAMLNDRGFKLPVLSTLHKTAVRVCLALWQPDPEVHGNGPGSFMKGDSGKTIAPTRHLNSLMNWEENAPLNLPRVVGVVILNGEIEQIDQLAQARIVWTTATCRPDTKRKRPPEDDGPGGGPSGGKRFQLGVIPRLQQQIQT
ncbi:MAG TPA: hypothetical protein VGV85_05640, partial [Longimicrobiaceae bacterium]|nr:hypothetical protein [Longimicrobiaceae bacterium]